MIRRNARLRREYLYRKGLEGKEREEYEKKRKIRQALEGEATRHFGCSPQQFDIGDLTIEGVPFMTVRER